MIVKLDDSRVVTVKAQLEGKPEHIEKLRDYMNNPTNLATTRYVLSEYIDKIVIDDKEIKVFIGSDNNFDPDTTVIRTSYNVDGVIGTLAIIGPKRMEYERVVNLLNYIKDNIDEKDN